MIVIVPVVDGVYPIVQALTFVVRAVRVHVLELKLPPEPPSLHDTVPVGKYLVPPAASATFALKCTGCPIDVVAGFGVTVVVLLRSIDVSDDVPELPL